MMYLIILDCLEILYSLSIHYRQQIRFREDGPLQIRKTRNQ